MIRIHGEIHSSKNSRRAIIHNGRNFVVKSAVAKQDEKTIGYQLMDYEKRNEWARMCMGQYYPLYVEFRFIRKTKRRWDFANLVQGVADAMVKAGYIPDDDVEHFIPVYVPHYVNKDAPGIEIEVILPPTCSEYGVTIGSTSLTEGE